MANVIQINELQDTTLWKLLNGRSEELGKRLAFNLIEVCAEAADRMKAMPTYAPEFTLHDERHLLRTTELMALVLGSQSADLNIAELGLLILAAFFHDQGMVPTEKEYRALQTDSDFQLYKDNWVLEHPNYAEIKRDLGSQSVSETERLRLAEKIADLDRTMLTDFLRSTHASRSASIVHDCYANDKRLEIQGVNVSPLLALLCQSHSLPIQSLTPQHGFRFDEQIGTHCVNMPFLAVILRLADILDFDRDRTPESLLKSIHFTSEVSLREWEKHRSVQGWIISPERIRFTMRSKHPVYEASARQYMDWIDAELSSCHELCRSQPQEFTKYHIDLPTQVDRSRIEPLNNAYRYHDLEFRLSRDEIVRLLMTDQLYGHPHLCIRELLQNSLDALRFRKALFASAGTCWADGEVHLRHYVDETGYEVIQCRDNGSGMDEDIIANHFVKVGRSFYRSPEFDRQRARLRETGNDFDPCSKFGIGFMSCFMLGDHIIIETRRDYGLGKEWGPPLVVEINGLSGLLVIRDGQFAQPIGTTVTIISRKKPSFLDSWTDKVNLITVLKGYALATEFPIKAQCTVPEIAETVTIPPQPERIPTLLEVSKIESIVTFEQDFAEVDKSLYGSARESFLIDENRLPCIENREAKWLGKPEGPRKKWDLVLLPANNAVDYDLDLYSVPVCVDGILVAGPPGRASCQKVVRRRLGDRNSNLHTKGPALIDARGEMKPELTPGRIPPGRFGVDLPPGWKRLNDKFRMGLGRLWGQMANYLANGLDYREFWRLTVVHEIWVPCIPHQCLWDYIAVSLIDQNGATLWQKVRDLGEMSMRKSEDDGFDLHDSKENKVGPDSQLIEWEHEGEERPNLIWHMKSVALLMSTLDIRDNKIVLVPTPPSDPSAMLSMYGLLSRIGVSMFLIDYVGIASGALTVETPYPTANRLHPLARLSHGARYVNEPSDLEEFAKAFVSCISETVSAKKGSTSLDLPGYWHKRVAHLYFAVNWERYDNSLKPPYRIWTAEKGWFDFEEDDLVRWRDCSASTG